MLELSLLLVAATAEPCIPLRDRDHIREITLVAIDQGLANQVANLFNVWLKDPSSEPRLAVAGMAKAISAYQRARANALSWNPPTC